MNYIEVRFTTELCLNSKCKKKRKKVDTSKTLIDSEE